MNKKSVGSKDAADTLVKSIHRRTSRRYSAEGKIRIVLRIARREHRRAVSEKVLRKAFTKWSKEFLEYGKRRLSGDTERQATSPEVKDLRSEALALKECVVDQIA